MNDLLTVEELADLLGVKVSWLYAQTSAKKIPFLKLGGRLRFRRADVERWIEGRVVQPLIFRAARRRGGENDR
ncbi:MAG: helix-turn-helix domain-containing protein [Chloroflexota bacterium]